MKQKGERETGGEEGLFWSDGKQDVECPCYDVCVVSVGAGGSMAFMEAVPVGSVGSAAAAAGSVAAVTVTEAVGAAVETGRSGATP